MKQTWIFQAFPILNIGDIFSNIQYWLRPISRFRRSLEVFFGRTFLSGKDHPLGKASALGAWKTWAGCLGVIAPSRQRGGWWGRGGGVGAGRGGGRGWGFGVGGGRGGSGAVRGGGGVTARVGFPQAFYPEFPNPPNSIYQHTAQNPHKRLNMFPTINPLTKCFKLFIFQE